jgi:hypothetical protein
MRWLRLEQWPQPAVRAAPEDPRRARLSPKKPRLRGTKASEPDRLPWVA